MASVPPSGKRSGITYLPSALPGILTGTILAISRGLGETAPLIIVGAATFITKNPTGLFSNFTALPIQIYNWTTRRKQSFETQRLRLYLFC